MTKHLWLAIVAAPILAVVVYTGIAFAYLAATDVPALPSIGPMLASGFVVGLVFEVVVVIPLYLTLHRWDRLRATTFISLSSLIWFVACMAVLLRAGAGWAAVFPPPL